MTEAVRTGKRARPGYRPDGERYRTQEWYFIDPRTGVTYGGYATRRDAAAAAAGRNAR